MSIVVQVNSDASGYTTGLAHQTARDVTLNDATGSLSLPSGASWFDGNIVLETDTEHVIVRNAQRSAYAKLQSLEHFAVDKRTFTFDRDECEPPQD